MKHIIALTHAAILRWRRWVISLLPDGLAGVPFIDRSHRMIHEFELDRMKVCVMNMPAVLNICLILSFICVIAAAVQSPMHGLPFGAFSVVGTVIPLFLYLWSLYVKRKLASQSMSSSMEWWLCICQQCVVLTSLFLWVIGPTFLSSRKTAAELLMAHRVFCLRYSLALVVGIVFAYLPLRLHLVVVSLQSLVVWMMFHWIVDFLFPVPVILGFVLPLLEFVGHNFAEVNNWRLYCLVEQERDARMLSETLMRTLRVVLNVAERGALLMGITVLIFFLPGCVGWEGSRRRDGLSAHFPRKASKQYSFGRLLETLRQACYLRYTS